MDRRIHKCAGPLLATENSLKNGCKEGDAEISSGHKLPAKCNIFKSNYFLFSSSKILKLIFCRCHINCSTARQNISKAPPEMLHILSEHDGQEQPAVNSKITLSKYTILLECRHSLALALVPASSREVRLARWR